jgi:hypothetical protein
MEAHFSLCSVGEAFSRDAPSVCKSWLESRSHRKLGAGAPFWLIRAPFNPLL